jgi:hypothetical protein
MDKISYSFKRLITIFVMAVFAWSGFGAKITADGNNHHAEEHGFSELLSVFLGGGSHTNNHHHHHGEHNADDNHEHSENETSHSHIELQSQAFVFSNISKDMVAQQIGVIDASIHNSYLLGYGIVFSLFRPPKYIFF